MLQRSRSTKDTAMVGERTKVNSSVSTLVPDVHNSIRAGSCVQRTTSEHLFYHLRILNFEQRLQDLHKEIQAFKRKEVMNIEEIKHNVGNLTQINANLEAAFTELEVRDTALLQCET